MVTMVLLILALVVSVNLSELGRFATARAFGVTAVELKKGPTGLLCFGGAVSIGDA